VQMDMGLDPGQQFLLVEGFDDIVLPSGIKALDDIFLLGKRGEKDNRDILILGVSFQLTAERKTIHAGHHDIKENNIRDQGTQQLRGLFRAISPHDIIESLLQDSDQGCPTDLVVINKKNRVRGLDHGMDREWMFRDIYAILPY
jgi:hypothetical protein